MYEQFFGLSEKPFSIQPDPSFLYWGRTHRLAYAMLEYGVLNHAGISVITGEVGCGKTTLIHRLLDQLSDTHTVALLSNIQEGRGDLLSWVLMGFGQEFAGKTHVELFAQLQSFFISEYAKGRRVVLIIDEAQNLSIDTLEELRMLSNINAGKDQLLQLILVGQPELKGVLNKPELLQLAQRVGSDFHLTPLNKEEVHAYIDTRLAIAGCQRRVFTDRAIDLIAEQSRGVPRVINIIADTALVYAFSSEELVVGVEAIRSVIKDKTEFGVFGLASDELTAPPLEARPDGSIDAFAGPAKAKASADIIETDGPEHRDTAPDPTPTPTTVQPSASESSPVVDKAVTSVSSANSVETEVIVEEKQQPQPVQVQTKSVAAPAKEESAVTGVVVISEGDKVSPEAAIRSAGDGRAIVFIGSGDATEATAIARKSGAVVAEGVDHVTATRGRIKNAGYRQLKKIAPHLKFVQFIDADKALDPDWITNAERFLSRRPEVTVVEGAIASSADARPVVSSISAPNRMAIDGEIECTASGSALVRADDFEMVGGFRGDLAAADFEDLCIRLRRKGSRIWRLENAMALSKKPAKPVGWWLEAVQRGFDNAFCASLHGAPPERLGVYSTFQAVIWGLLFPLGVLLAAAVSFLIASQVSSSTAAISLSVGIGAFGVMTYLFLIVLASMRLGLFKASSWAQGVSAVLGRFPEVVGAMKLWLRGKGPR